MTKKQAKQIAELINSCTVWSTMVTKELDKTTGYNSKKARYFMNTHDEAGKKLNEILGLDAITLYTV